jgi:hypothetical protein
MTSVGQAQARTGSCVPSELPLGQDEAHERDVGRYAECPEAEDDGRFRGTPGVALERAAPVQRRVRCGAATEAKIRSDHSHRRPCTMNCILADSCSAGQEGVLRIKPPYMKFDVLNGGDLEDYCLLGYDVV